MTQPTKPASSSSDHVFKTLEALSRRPGVESTLILSRKDGSIIKVKGSLEEPSSTRSAGSRDVRGRTTTAVAQHDGMDARAVARGDGGKIEVKEALASEMNKIEKDDRAGDQTTEANSTSGVQPQSQVQSESELEPEPEPEPKSLREPTRAEKLAAEIFQFVNLSSSLASSVTQLSPAPPAAPSSPPPPPPPGTKSEDGELRSSMPFYRRGGDDGGDTETFNNRHSTSLANGVDSLTTDGTFAAGEDNDRRQQPSQPADEVQLLRMRSKKREIIIYPDQKFLSCVIQNLKAVE